MTLDQQAIVFRLQDEKGGAEDRSASRRDLAMSRCWWQRWHGVGEELNSHLLHGSGVTSQRSSSLGVSPPPSSPTCCSLANLEGRGEVTLAKVKCLQRDSWHRAFRFGQFDRRFLEA